MFLAPHPPRPSVSTLGATSWAECTLLGGTTHGFLLDKDGSFTSVDVPGASSSAALSINSQGEIVGTYAVGGTTHGFLAR